jgi:hypothetical protein
MIIRARYIGRIGEVRNTHKILFPKPEGKRLLWIRWEDNIKMDLKETRVSVRVLGYVAQKGSVAGFYIKKKGMNIRIT